MRATHVGVAALVAVLVAAAYFAAVEEVRQAVPLAALEGPVDDCGCSASYLVQMNGLVHGAMARVDDLRFFQFFKVNYWRECLLWEEEFSCTLDDSGLGGCHICPCDMSEIPEEWKCEEEPSPAVIGSRALDADLLAASQDVLDTHVSGFVLEDPGYPHSWIDSDSSAEFINLRLNPERNTGYVGEEAKRVWRAIYEENCFTGPLDEQCLEERVFYRLVSGLQSSIACHVAERFYIHERPGVGGAGAWRFEPNVELFSRMVGGHRDRLNNMLFTWLFLERAVEQAKALVLAEEFSLEAGDAEETRRTVEAVREIYGAVEEFECQMDGSGQCGFQERSMFTSSDKRVLEAEFRSKFRNVTAIMDCVMCQNCRVHGKLSTLGLATALKVLLDIRPGRGGEGLAGAHHLLTRNEVVALFQTFYKFTKAVEIVGLMQARVEAQAARLGLGAAGLALATFLLLLALLRSAAKAVLVLATLFAATAAAATYDPAGCRAALSLLAGSP